VRRLLGDDNRNLAAAWIETHLPPRAHIVREEYTPQPDPQRYRVEYTWSLAFADPADYADDGVDVLIASQGVYGRFLGPGRAQHAQMAQRYAHLFATRPAASFFPGPTVNGPLIYVYRLDAAPLQPAR
jgi:hypothetical protein